MAAKTTNNVIRLIMTLTTVTSLIMTSSACPVRECSCQTSRNGVVIDCQNKNFDKIPEFITGTEKYHELKLNGNNIAIIPGKAFKKLNLEKLDLSDNPVRKISELAFEGLETSLKELVLEAKTDTPIKFPVNLLHSLQVLETVTIKGFDMPVLEHGIFAQSKNLQRLTLENCKIITIFPTAFQGLEDKLTELDLTNNRLTAVPVHELNPLVHLRKLILAQNRITSINHHTFSNSTQLIDLDLSQNSIQNIESGAFSGIEQSLEYLGLHGNMISQSSLLSIANLGKLEQLNLAYNLFMNTLPDFTFKNLDRLAYLNLQGNRLTTISPLTFEGLSKSLSVLILSENKLSTLPDEGFRHLENLKWLYLDLMQLGGTLTQHTFHGLENTLEYLTMEGSKFMDKDWNSIHYLRGLKTLNLCQNEIESIPKGTFVGMPALEQLQLCHNKVHNLTEESLRGLEESLRELNLESNGIQTIDKCTLSNFKQLKDLNLNGNPLNCDCRLKWLRQWIEQQTDFQKMLIGWQCANPHKHMDRLLKHVALEDLTCTETPDIVCTDYVKPTAQSEVPHVRIKTAEVTDNSVSLKWTLEKQETILGVRLFYKMTHNETYAYTLLLNPLLREYIIHDLNSETNYTICIGLDLKLSGHLPDEECITITTKKLRAPISNSVDTGNSSLIIIVGSAVGGVIFVVFIVCSVFQLYKWRQKRNDAKEGLYDTPWVTSRPQAPSLSTLPSRRSDFENPMRHYYSRPLSTGTVQTVSSNIPRSNSMATMMDADMYGQYKRNTFTKSADELAPVYDMDRCLYKIDKMMASASNLLVHQPPQNFNTPIPPPYQQGCQNSPDMPPYPEEVSDYPCENFPPNRQSYPMNENYNQQRSSYPNQPLSPQTCYPQSPQTMMVVANQPYPQVDFTPKTFEYSLKEHGTRVSMLDRDSGHMSGFPSCTSGFDELEPPPIEHNSRGTQDPLPPPPAYMLDQNQQNLHRNPDLSRSHNSLDSRHIYDEIYTLY